MGESTPAESVEFRKVCGMKNIHLFFVCIFIFPLMLGVVIITLAEAYMIRTYFKTTIENISSQVQEQTFTVQCEMMAAYKYYLTTYYKETFSEMFRIRNLINSAINEAYGQAFIDTVVAQTTATTNLCLESTNIGYTTFPLCTDMNYLTDYKLSTEQYKINIGHAFTILHGGRNGDNDRSTIQSWKLGATSTTYPNEKKDLALMMALAPVLTSFLDNKLENLYSSMRYDRSMIILGSPMGLYGANYFNYEYVNDMDISKADCNGMHPTMPPIIKFDPRCRPWYKYALLFTCRMILASPFLGNKSVETFSNFYPIIVAPQPEIPAITARPMRVALLMVNSMALGPTSLCKNDWSGGNVNPKEWVIMKEISLYSVMNMIAKSFARSTYNLLFYTEDNPDKQAKATTLQGYFNNLLLKDANGGTAPTAMLPIDPQDYLQWVRQVAVTMGDIYRIYVAHLYTSPTEDSTVPLANPFSYKYMMDSRYNDWYSNNVNSGSGGTLASQTPDVQLQMTAEKNLMEGFLRDNFKFSPTLVPLSKVTYNFDFPKAASGGVLELTKALFIVDSLGTIDPVTKKYVEVLKIVFVVPDSLIIDKYKVLIGIIDQQIFNNAIISFCIIVFFLLCGLYAVLRFASKLTLHLNETLEVAEKVEKSQPIYQDKDDLTKNMNYEVQESKTALFKLNNIFNSTSGPTNSKNKDKDQEANDQNNVLKYAFQIKLFTMLNDKMMIGVLCNNLGNLHFNSGRYMEAVEKYQQSVDYLEEYNNSSTSDTMMIPDEVYTTTKCNRIMNMCSALKRYIESTPNKEISKLDRLKKATNFVKDKVSDAHVDRHIKCLINLAWVSRYKDEVQNALNQLQQAFDRFSKNKAALDPNVSFMYQQEIEYERAMVNLKEKKYPRALILITQSLIRDEHFEMDLRIKQVRLLVDLFGLLGYKLTPGVADLKERFLEKNPIRRYVIALDYSASMKTAGKIDNSIKAILTIWDQFIRPVDKACFCRFNINCDVVFTMEEKGINTFAKRVEIEKSSMPRDRTSFFDAIYKSCSIIKNERSSLPSKNYVIIFCDGDDTSSLKQQKDAMDIVATTNVTIIAIGLGLKGDQKTKQMMLSAAKASKGGLYLDIFDNDFEILFQVISQYANNRPYSELNKE